MASAIYSTGAVVQVNKPNKENELPDTFTFIQHLQQSPITNVGLKPSQQVHAKIGPVMFDGYISPEWKLVGTLNLLNIQLGKVYGDLAKDTIKANATLAAATGDVHFVKKGNKAWMGIDVSVLGSPWKEEKPIWPPQP